MYRTLCRTLSAYRAVALEIVADDLNVNGSRQSEVQDLADDVGGQKCKSHPRKFLGSLSRRSCTYFVGRTVFGGKADQNVGIGRPDRRRVAVGQD